MNNLPLLYLKSLCKTGKKVHSGLLLLLVVCCFSFHAEAALSGNYTVDPSGSPSATNYLSVGAALDDLKGITRRDAGPMGGPGITGPVTFTISAGTYIGQLDFPAITGVSATNTITFDGGVGNAASRIITYSGATSLATAFTLKLNSSPYIRFYNVTIEAGNVNYGWPVHIAGNSHFSQVKNCIITFSSSYSVHTNTNFCAIVVNGGTTTPTTGTGIRGVEIDSNTILKGYGNYIVGGNTANDSSVFFRNNVVDSTNFYGLYIASVTQFNISNNKINMIPFSNIGNSSTGIYITNCAAATGKRHIVSGNWLANCGSYGIFFTNSAGQPALRSLLYNNSINGGFKNVSNASGIYFSSNSATWDVFYNSVNLDLVTTGANNAALYVGNTNVVNSVNNLDVRNNIFAVTGTGSSAYPIYFTNGYQYAVSNSTTTYALNNNVYYKAGIGNNDPFLYITNGTVLSKANYIGNGGYNVKSVALDPLFVNNKNLLPQNPCLRGVPLTSTTLVDITGATRSTIAPNMGAYEATPLSDDIGIERLISPAAPFTSGTKDISVLLRNYGSTTITSANISYMINGSFPVTYNFTGSLAPCDTIAITFTGANQFSFLPNTPYSIKIYSDNPNFQPDTRALNDTFNVPMLFTGLSGNYTIDQSMPTGSTNFASFTEAANALNYGGISGPVNFEILGTAAYNEQISLDFVTGVSASNTITFDGGPGNALNRTLTFAATATAPHTFRINNTPYVTLKNFTIRGSSLTNAWPVHIMGNAASNVTVKTCNIDFFGGNGVVGNSQNYNGVVINSSATSLTTPSTAINIEIDGNSITGGNTGIYAYGQSSNNYLFTNNKISGAFQNGLYFYYINAFRCNNNVIDMNPSGSVGSSGIYAYFCVNTGTYAKEISNNVITNAGQYGIQSYYMQASSTLRSKIINNAIGGTFRSTDPSGIYLYQNVTYADIWFNSVNMNNVATSTTSAALRVNSSSSSLDARNNNLAVTDPNSSSFALISDASSSFSELNYNNYFKVNPSRLITLSGTVYAVHNYKGVNGYNLNAFNINPSYVSATNLKTNLLCNKGVAIPSVTRDFEGDLRASVPDIGADENLSVTGNDLTVVELLNPTTPLSIGSQDLRVMIRNNGNTVINSAEIAYAINGATPVIQQWFGNLNPCESAIVEFNTTSGGGNSQQFRIVPGFAYSFKVYSATPNFTADGNTFNDTITFGPLCPSLNGQFYIDSSATVAGVDTFTSFTTAAAALNCGGVSGPVVFNVLKGTYNEQITINDIAGASAINTITFDGGAGNDSTRILAFGAQTNTTRHTLLFNSSKYISLRNLTLRSNGATYGWPLHIMGATNFISVKNCVIDFTGAGVTGTSNNFISAVVNNSTTTPTTTGTFNNIEFDGNKIAGGFSNIYVSGNGANTNIFIRNNKLYNSDNYGLYVSNIIAPKIAGNTVNMRVASLTSTGIYLNSPVSNATGNAEIVRNRVYDAGQIGIQVNAGTATVLRPNMVNNSVGGLFRNTSTLGIQGIHISSSPNWNVIYNSVLIDTPATGANGVSAAALYITGSTLLDCRNNNLLVNHVTAGIDVLPFRSTSGVTFVTAGLNYNNYYKEGNPANYIQVNGTYYTSANFNTAAAGGLNSVSNNSGFVALSGKDLVPVSATNNGINVPFITSRDINDSIRNNPPDMGAFEIPSGLTNDLGIIATISPDTALSSGSKQVIVRVKNFGLSTISSFNLRHTVNGANMQDSAFSGLSIAANEELVIGLDVSKNAIIPGAVATTYKVYLHNANNGALDDNQTNDTITLGPKIPSLNGVYTINKTGSGVTNYTSFTNAVAALNTAGVSGPVTFMVAADTYTEQVNLNAIVGVSATNTITFDGGNALNTTLQFATTSASYWTVKLNNSPYVTLKNLTIQTTGNTDGVAVQIAGTSDYARVKNCRINITGTGQTSVNTNFGGILISSTTTSTGLTSTGTRASFLEIDSNTFNYGYYGIYSYGLTSTPYANNNKFRGNIFNNQYYYGTYFYYNEAINYSNNKIAFRPHNSTSYGLYLNGCQNTGTNFHMISANNFDRSNRFAIYVSSGNGAGRSQIVNNFARGFGSTTGSGIYLTNANNYDIYHNTIFYDTVTTSSSQYAALYLAYGSNFDVKNNIFVSFQTGPGIPVYLPGIPGGYFLMNYNNLYKVNGTASTGLLYFNNITYSASTLAGGSGLNASSVSVNPEFVSNSNLHLSNPCSGKGVGLSGVTTDIDGDLRKPIPNMGADEGTGLLNDIGIAQIKPFTAGLQDVRVLIRNYGSNTVTAADVTYIVNGGSPKTINWTGSIGPCDTVTVAFSGVNQFNFLPGTTYNIKAYTASPNASVDAKSTNDTLNMGPSCVSLSGVYTINKTGSGNTNYTSFNNAVAALSCGGVSGPVVFNVAADDYTEQILINNIPGASATNTVSFVGASSATTRLTFGAPATATAYTVKLEGASFVNFRDLNIINTGTSYGAAVVVSTNTNNISIKKCVLELPSGATGTGSIGLLVSAATNYSNPSVNVGGVSNIFLDSSRVLYGSSGVYIYSVTSTPYASNISVTNTVFDSSYNYGVYHYYAERINIDRNVFNMRVNGSTNSNGIYSPAAPGSNGIHNISNNRIYNAGQYGIYLSSVYSNSQTPRSQINNNVVGGTFRTANSSAIALQSCFYFDIFNNTFRSNYPTGSEQYSTAYFTNCQLLDVRNNHFIYDATGGGYPLNVTNTGQITTLNFNNYFNSGGSVLAAIEGSLYNATNINGGGGYNQNSKNINPGFASATNLVPGNACINGVAIASVTTDVLNNLRNSPPDVGAYEYQGSINNDLGVTYISSPVIPFTAGNYPITVRLNNFGANAINNAVIKYSINGAAPVSYSYTGPLNACDVQAVTISSSPVNFALGTAYTIKVWSEQPNSVADGNMANDTFVVKSCAILPGGNYTINASGSGSNNFTSFAAAAGVLNCGGINGPVTFNVAPGTYTEQVLLQSVPGASSTNTITFDGGDSATTKLEFASGTDNNQAYTFRIQNTPYVALRNLTIVANGTSNGNPVHIMGSCDNVSVKKCLLTYGATGQTTTSGNFIGILINNEANISNPTSNGSKANNLLIDSNKIEYGYYGIMVFGNTSSTPYTNGNTFRYNTLTNTYYYGMYYYYTSGLRILNNKITMRTGNGNSSGMQLMYCYLNTGMTHDISANSIINAGQYGVYIQSVTHSATARGRFVNNMIGGGFGSSSAQGLYMASSTYWDIFHNSINLDVNTNSATSAAFYNTGANNDIRNNHFIHSGTAGTGLPFYSNQAHTAAVLDYNNYYRASTVSADLLYANSTTYTKTTFKVASGINERSLNEKPEFKSRTDLHLASGCAGKAVSIASVTNDIDGNTRNATPNIGADEVLDLNNDVGLVMIRPFSEGLQDVKVLIRNYGANALTSVNLSYSVNGSIPKVIQWTGTLNPCDTVTVAFTGVNQYNFQAGIAYTIEAYSSNPNLSADPKTSNDTLIIGPTCISLSGNFTINKTGSGGNNYTSFGNALNALLCGGVSGPVVFNVAADDYEEQLLIGNIPGASATNTVSFVGAGASTTTLWYSAPSTEYGYTVRLAGASFINFREMKISNTGSTYGVPVSVAANTTNINIRKCVLEMPAASATNQGSIGLLVSATTNYSNPSVNVGGVSNIVLDSSRVVNGYAGVYVYGATSTPYISSVSVTNSVFDSTYYYGVYNYYAERMNVDGNVFNMRVVGNNNSTGIYSPAAPNSSVAHNISNNRIYNAGQYGIYLSSVYTTPSTLRSKMINNAIGGTFRTASSSAIALQSCFYFDIFHNTFRSNFATGSEQYSTAYFSNCSQLDIRNNQFVYDAVGGGYPINLATTGQITTLNYNNYYNAGGSILAAIEGVLYNINTLNGGAGHNANSRNINPGFVSATNLVPGNACINGIALAAVPNDISGNVRNTPPDMGAYEFQGSINNDLGITFISSPLIPFTAGSYPIRVRLNNFGGNTITAATIQYSINGSAPVSYSFTGTLASCDTQTVTITSSPISFVLGTSYTIKVWSEQPNGTADGNNSNDTISVKSCAVLPGGSYTIDATGSGANNFTSFDAATAVLNCGGISGPVTFTVAANTYQTQVLLQNVTGVSATNTITFIGASAATTRIEFASGTDNTLAYTFRIQNTPYVTLRNLTIAANGTTNGNPLHIMGSCDNVTVKNCVLTFGTAAQSSTSSNYIALLINNEANVGNPTSNGSKANNLVIDSNRIEYGYYGIMNFGNSSSPYINNNSFRYNTITGSYYYGMYFYYNSGLRILNNKVNMRAGNPNSTGVYAVVCFNNTGSYHEMSANRVMNAGQYGVQIQSTSNSSTARGRFVNNMIGGGFSSTSSVGVYMQSSTYWDIFNNTIYLDAVTNSATGAALYNTGSNNDIRNNHLIHAAATGNGLPFYSSQALVNGTLNYNNYYRASNASTDLLYVNATTYTSSNFIIPGGVNANSLNINPGFTPFADFRVGGCYKGVALGVTTDYDGQLRNSPPDIGADEAESNDATIMAISSPVEPVTAGFQDIVLTIKNNGTNVINSLNVSYDANGSGAVTQSLSSMNLQPCSTMVVTFTGSQQYNFPAGRSVIVANTSLPNGVADKIPSNDTLRKSLCGPLNGSYTISKTAAGASNFISFNEAIATMLCAGVTGPVTFDVAADTYTEQVTVPVIPGTSAINTVTFDGGAGNAATRKITFAPTNTNARHTVKFDTAGYVTFRNLTIENTGSTFGWGVHFGSAANNNSVVGCIVDLSNAGTSTSTNFVGVVATNSSTSATTEANIRNIRIDSNTVKNGYYSVAITGNSTAPDTAISIQGNTVQNAYYYGIYANNVNGIRIDRNNVSTRGNGANLNQMGIYVNNSIQFDSASVISVSSNKVYNVTQNGIYLWTVSGLWNSMAKLHNNMVGGGFQSNSATGIYIGNNSTYWEAYHNSVNLDVVTNSETNSAMFVYVNTSNILMKNNNLAVTAAGSSGYPLFSYNTTAFPFGGINYNNYYKTGIAPGGNLIYIGSAYTTTNYTNVGGLSSFNREPGFRGNTNLHTLDGCFNGDSLGVIYDIDGDLRAAYGDIGADEVTDVLDDIGVTALLQPRIPLNPGLTDIQVIVGNFGTNPVANGYVHYSVNGGTPYTVAFTDTIYPCDTLLVTFNGANQYDFVSGTYSIKAYTSLPNFLDDTKLTNDTFTTPTVCLALAGNYTINPSGSGATNFTTFQAALNALYCGGVSAPVTFDVAAGTFREQLVVGTIAGTSSTNTVTFTGGAGNAATRVLVFGATDNLNRQTVRFSGSSYVSFENMTIRNEGVQYAWPVHIHSGSRNISLKNNIIEITGPGATATNNNFVNVVMSSSVSSATSSMRADSITIDTNIINGGYASIYSYNQQGIYQNFNNNILNNPVTYGLYIYNSYELKFRNNQVNMLPTGDLNSVGLYLYVLGSTASTTHEITGNKIKNMGQYGINLYNSSGSPGGNSRIENNFIGGGFRNTTSHAGIYGEYSYYWNIYFNSINLDTACANQSGAIYLTNCTGLDIRNNIMAVTKANSNALPFYAATAANVAQLDNNNYYKAGSAATLIYLGAPLAPNAYVGASGRNFNSFSIDPQFTSATDLHVNNGCNNGITIAGSLVDIDGHARTTPPDVGADEVILGFTDNIGVTAILSPSIPLTAGTQDVVVILSNLGNNTVTNAAVSYTVNGSAPVTQYYTDTIQPCDTALIVFTGSNGYTFDPSTPYVIKAYSSFPNLVNDNNTADDTTKVGPVCAAMAGAYTISRTGSGPYNFTSFNAAVSALLCGGVSDDVTFNVSNDTYTEQVLIPAIQGVNDTTRITFIGQSQTGTVLTYNAGNPTSAYTLRINTSPYITFRRMTIRATGGAVGNPVHIMGASNDVHIKQCNIEITGGASSTNTPFIGVLVNANADVNNPGSGTGSYVNNLQIDSNNFKAGYYSVFMYGRTNTPYSSNNMFRGNTMDSAFYTGFYAYYNSGIRFSNNTLNMRITGTTNSYGIYLTSCNNSGTAYHEVSANRIINAGAYGMYVINTTSSNAFRSKFINNMIGGGFRTTAANGIAFLSANFWDIYHNSINMDAATNNPQYAALYFNTATASNIRNNIFVHTAATGTGLPVYIAGLYSGVMDNNMYYTASNTHGNLLYINGTTYDSTISSPNSYLLGGGANSFRVAPVFMSAKNLSLTQASRKGASTLGITTDIDGETRVMPPDIGADEYFGVLDAGVYSIDSPTTANFCGTNRNIVVRLKNYGNQVLSSASINYDVNGSYVGTYSWSGTLAPGAVSPQIRIASHPFTGGNYNLSVYTTNVNATPDDVVYTNDTAYRSFTTTPTVVPTISLSASQTTLCSGVEVTFIAQHTGGGATPTLQWRKNGLTLSVTGDTLKTTALNDQDSFIVILTSSAACANPLNVFSNSIRMNVGLTVAPDVAIASSHTTICAGEKVTFTATPLNGGFTPTYSWYQNGVLATSDSSKFETTTLQHDDTVYAILHSSLGCANPSTDTSSAIKIHVNPLLYPAATISASATSFCAGTSVTFAATSVNPGTTPAYQWKRNGINVGLNDDTLVINTLNDNDSISLVMTSNATCATPAVVESNKVPVHVTPLVIPSVSITNTSGTICTGSQASFTATPVNAGVNATYNWTVNSVSAGTGLTFSSSLLNHRDTVRLIVTADTLCASPQQVTSNAVLMDVKQYVTPDVTVTPANPSICAGSQVSFTATPVNGGTAPSYQWLRNGSVVGTDSVKYQGTFSTNDSVAVIITSNEMCLSQSTDTSVYVKVSITPPVVPAVSISVSADSVCANGSLVFTATPVNGGSTPSYQWKKNGVNIGTNNPVQTFSNMNNNDSFSVVLTSNATCASPTTASSARVGITVIPNVVPSVTVAASVSTICAGGSVTFTATPVNGGATPSYQWKKNGNNIGANDSVQTFTNINNNDNFTVVLTSNERCAAPAAATSAGKQITVTPNVTPSVSVNASKTSICLGESVTYTATPLNGGTTPSYQWKVNGVNAGTNSNTFTSSSISGSDTVTVELTSSVTCVTVATVVSNKLKLNANPPVVPSVTVAASATSICNGTGIRFVATAVNGGSNPGFQWKVNGSDVSGQTNDTFDISTLSNNDSVSVVITSNALCASPATVASAKTGITVTMPVTPSLSIEASTDNICAGGSVTYTATPSNGGSTPTYQWLKNGLPVGTNSPTYTTTDLQPQEDVTCRLTTSLTCVTAQNVLEFAPSVLVKTPPAKPVITRTANTLSTLFASQSYQWFKNDTAVSGATSRNFELLVNGQYKVQVDSNGCSNSSDQFSVSDIDTGEVGLNEISTIGNIELYPNPAKSSAYLNVLFTTSAPTEISIVDMYGKLVRIIPVGTVNSFSDMIDMHEYADGVYFVLIKHGNDMSQKRLVKAD